VSRDQDGRAGSERGGLVAWFAGNPVASNVLMVLLLVGGLATFLAMRVEVFPEVDPGQIRVSVPYPGASPEEVEQGISRRVEEAIAGIEGIERVRSTSSEGNGVIVAELTDQADDREVLDDVKAAVDQLQDFPPEDAEEPRIVDQDAIERVATIALSGKASERSLRELAHRVRDDLTALDSVTIAEVTGARAYEVAVEAREVDLRRHGLTFDELASAVRQFSLDLPGGTIRSTDGDLLLRTLGQAYRAEDFEAIVVRAESDGTILRLGDVATVIDGFEDTDQRSLFNGRPAVFVEVSRVGDQRVLEIERDVIDYLESATWPVGVTATLAENRAEVLRSRMNLLLRNGVMGLVLVFGCLVLFLDLKLAFWTTAGIPISFLGSFAFIAVMNGSVNMISLFAFIIVLGLVVDDAIVVGESIFSKLEEGLPPLQAVIAGARAVIAPVTVAVLTTMIAFLPLYFTPGFFGDILWVVPVVVIGVLAVSLIEALLILPAHLAGRRRERTGLLPSLQRALRRRLASFIEGAYTPFLKLAIRNRYLTVAIATAVLFSSVGLVHGGFVRVLLFPPIEADQVKVTLEMARGAALSETERGLRQLLDAADALRAEVDEEHGTQDDSLFKYVSASLGDTSQNAGGGPHSQAVQTASHVSSVSIALTQAEDRPISATDLEQRWRELAGEIPGAVSVSFSSALMSAGDDIAIELAHAEFETLLLAVERLKGELLRYEGVVDVQDSFEAGKRELRFGLTDAGLAAGLTLHDLGRQLRQGFQGDEAQRVQRGRDDVKVLVRYAEEERTRPGAIANRRIRLPDGTEVPLLTVATVEERRGYASIERTDRRRTVTVSAKVIDAVADPAKINATLGDEVLPVLALDYPGLAHTFEGAQRERMESLAGLVKLLAVALIAMYGLLATQLKSYGQPLLIMSVIPMGAVGALIGHVLLGFPISFLSSFGLVALAGVVVNDSLVLMDFANKRRALGDCAQEAVFAAGPARFRPILFTTLTTCLGLAPMISETSVQAQFLIPVAISLAGGVAFATVITLIVLPSLYCIFDDLVRLTSRATKALAGHD
jgi:multidrug efflux pump subunit AcrB